MNKNLSLALASALAMTIAMTPAVFPQGLLIEPDTLNFGNTPIGLIGLPDSFREIEVTNRTNQDLTLTVRSINIANPDNFKLFSPDVAAVQPILRRIYDAVGCYRQDYNESPVRVFDLAALGYLHIEEEFLWRWHFSLIGQDPTTQIEAVSGNVTVLFDIQMGDFVAYDESINEIEPIREFVLRAGEHRLLAMAYSPTASEETEGWISLVAGQEQYRISVTGNGIYRRALELSNNALNFGGVYNGRRLSRGLQITNTAGVFSRVSLEVTNSRQFYAYDGFVAEAHDFLLEISEAIKRHHERFGEDPPSVESLLELGYLELPEDLGRMWTFVLIGSDPVTQIEAVSTAELPRGAGHVVLFDVQTNTFSGHGFHNFEDPDLIYIGKDRDADVIVAFMPDQFGRVEGTLRLRSYFQERSNEFQEFNVALRGDGLAVATERPGVIPESMVINPPYPSPFNSSAIVSFQTPFAGMLNASLLDVGGREWTKWTIPQSIPGSGNLVIDGAGLPAGVYWLRFSQGELNAVRKVVLVK